MSHWHEKYVGRKYDRETYNCGHLAIQVNKDEFGRDISLVIATPDHHLSDDEQIQSVKNIYAYRVETPQEGDGVLLMYAGKASHVGVYCLINNVPHVLHGLDSSKGVCLTKIRKLSLLNMEVEGYYRFRTTDDENCSLTTPDTIGTG